MAASSVAHGSLRKEGAETPPDLSYRFVVGFGTWQAADAAWRARAPTKKKGWRRVAAFLGRQFGLLIGGVLVFALSCVPAVAIFYAVDAMLSRPIAGLSAIVTCLAAMLGIRIAVRRLQKRTQWRAHQELYVDNEFRLEGRKSHLWVDGRFAGFLYRWSRIERVVEFEQGMYLALRQRTAAGPARGIIVISKECLPGSCAWDELKAYVDARLAEDASPQE